MAGKENRDAGVVWCLGCVIQRASRVGSRDAGVCARDDVRVVLGLSFTVSRWCRWTKPGYTKSTEAHCQTRQHLPYIRQIERTTYCIKAIVGFVEMMTNLVEVVNSVLRCTYHLPISAVFSATFYRSVPLMPRMGLRQAKQIEAKHVYVESVQKAMAINSRRVQTMNAELYSCDLGAFRVQEYICRRLGLSPKSYEVACARAKLNVEQVINEIYTLQRTLRIWGNKFPVIPDVSNWEVPPPAFEMLRDRSLHKHLKGRPQLTRIQNDIDVRETSEPKVCMVC
ncbi:hypothetical protein GOBAR_DD27154 [Gossypium barbadense]|nr:hypothetical protein GOBAR_DD27154 [Gossypium barbadense]